MSAEPKLSTLSIATRLVLLSLVIGLAVITADADTYSFVSTGALAAAEESGSAALLADGNVLVFGADGGALPELYDAGAGAFLPVLPLDQTRAGAGGVRMDDGRVLIAGGWNGAFALDTALLFDPATRAFAQVTAHMTTARVHPSVIHLLDGRVLVAGGTNAAGVDGSAEIFDPSTSGFVATAPMVVSRLGTATLLNDGTVLFAGGQTADGSPTAAAEVFDPSSSSFTLTMGSMATARRSHQATRLSDGRVLITGGYGADGAPVAQAELFDPVAGTFQTAGTMANPRADHRAVLLPSGEGLMIGGRDLSGAVASAEVYSPATGLFTATAALIDARWSPATASLNDGRVLVAGGRSSAGMLATAEIYGAAPVPPAKLDTTTTLTSSNPASTYGQPVTLQAQVTTSGIGVPTGNVRFVDNGNVLALAALDASGIARVTLTTIPAGTHSITAEYGGSALFNPSTSPAISQSVAPIHANATLTESPLARQYSDRIIVDATVTPATAAKSVTFMIGNQELGSAPLVAGKAHLEPQLLGVVPPGVRIVFARFKDVDPNYEIYDPYRSMTVMREDARVAFTGPTTVNTGCSSCSAATVRLEATVSDISLVSPATDSDPGDVGMANVAFVNRATGTIIQTVPVTPDPKDHRTGKAVYDWPVNIGKNSSQTFTIGMSVGNQYIRNSTTDDGKVTVVKR